MKHKKVLFEYLTEEENKKNQPQKTNKKILVYNILMSFFYGFFKILTTLIVCILGTFAITILFTALMQSKTPIEVAQEIFLKISYLF